MLIVGLSPVFVILICLMLYIKWWKGWYAENNRDDSNGLLIKSERAAFYKKKLGVSADQSLVLFCHFCGEDGKLEQCQSCGNFNCWCIWDRQFCCARCDTTVGSVNCAYCGKDNAVVNILLLQNPRIELAQALQPWRLWFGFILIFLISGGILAFYSYKHLVNEKPTLAFNGYGAEVLVGTISLLALLIYGRWVSKNLYLRKNLMKYAAEWEGNVSKKNPSNVKKLASGLTASVGLA